MTIYSQISQNKTKTIVIMLFFVAFITMVGFLFGKAQGNSSSYFLFALLFSFGSSFTSYYWGDKIVLGLNGAHPADKKTDFDFYTVTENLAIAGGIPMPKLYVIETEAINAFATGRDPKHAVICATRGLLSRLNRREIEGVVAHEMSHIGNYDIRLMLIVAILVGIIASLSNWFMRSLWWGRRSKDENNGTAIFVIIGIILALISPILATLIQLAVSRKREYLADASGVLLTRYPNGLADALEKIKNDYNQIEGANTGTAHLFIANPFKNKKTSSWFVNLFNTHPPIEERIRILRSM